MSKDYSGSYSESAMWDKIAKFASKAGKDVIFNVLKLYYAIATGTATPTQIAAIVAAIGYFISPVDAIPDMLPLGFTDDAGILAAAVSSLACCSNPTVVAAARRKLNEWF